MLYVLKNPWVNPALDRMNITTLSVVTLNMIFALILVIKKLEEEQGVKYNVYEQRILGNFMLVINALIFVYPWVYKAYEKTKSFIENRIQPEDLLAYFKLIFGLGVIGGSVFATGTGGQVGGSTLNFFGIFMAFLMQCYIFGSAVGLGIGILKRDVRVSKSVMIASHVFGEVCALLAPCILF
jgi:hypothetical protein